MIMYEKLWELKKQNDNKYILFVLYRINNNK